MPDHGGVEGLGDNRCDGGCQPDGDG